MLIAIIILSTLLLIAISVISIMMLCLKGIVNTIMKLESRFLAYFDSEDEEVKRDAIMSAHGLLENFIPRREGYND